MKEKIILIGGGGHCKSVIDVIEQENRFEIAGIVEKFSGESQSVLSYPIIGVDDELESLRKLYRYACITVGHIKSNDVRVRLFHRLLELDFTLPVIVSPRAYISKYSSVADGTVVMHDVCINADVQIGKNCIVNSKALIEHDSVVEDQCHISTGVILNGDTHVLKNSFIGSGSVVKECSQVNGFIRANSLVK